MVRWLLLVARNRVAVVLVFAAVAVVIGGAGLLVFRQFRQYTVGAVVAGVVALALILWLTKRSARFDALADRMLAEERAADPRPRY